MTSVSYASEAPLDGGFSSGDMKIEGRSDKSKVEVLTLWVGPDYFGTMKIHPSRAAFSIRLTLPTQIALW